MIRIYIHWSYVALLYNQLHTSQVYLVMNNMADADGGSGSNHPTVRSRRERPEMLGESTLAPNPFRELSLSDQKASASIPSRALAGTKVKHELIMRPKPPS